MKIKFKIVLLLILGGALFSCDKNTTDPTPLTNNTETIKLVKNLPANPTDGSGTGHFTLFSFSENNIIAIIDSNSTKWDIGFNGTTIIVNSGTSGPGNTQAQVYTGLFDNLTIAPTSGYSTDNNKTTPPNAIPTGSGNGWYNYNSTTHVLSAIPGRVLLFKTTDNKYVKIEIVSYYKNAPTSPSNTDISRYYTLRYSIW